eukprot:tig00020553_g10525.t1
MVVFTVSVPTTAPPKPDLVSFCYDIDVADARGAVRLWGRTLAGEAVLVHVLDHHARFHVAPNPGASLEALRAALGRTGGATVSESAERVLPFEGYRAEPLEALAVRVPYAGVWDFFRRLAKACSNAPPLVLGFDRNRTVAFHADTGTSPASWLRVRGGGRAVEPGRRHAPSCAFELVASVQDVLDANAEMEGAVPPLRVAYWDIETVAERGSSRVPDAAHPGDRAVQISVVRAVLGRDEDEDRAVGALGECGAVPGCEIVSFSYNPMEAAGADAAEGCLIAWFVERLKDADVMVTWNGACYDLPFLATRSSRLPGDPVRRLGKDARPIGPRDDFRGRLCGPADRKRAGDDHAQRVTAGLVHFDLLQEVRDDTSLRGFVPSLKLGVVASSLLGETKDDLSISALPALFRDGGAEGRARIARYCLRDASLLYSIARKRESLGKSFALCRATGVPLQMLQFGGSTLRGATLISRAGRSPQMPVPVFLSRPLGELASASGTGGRDEFSDLGEEDGYAGARVLEPMVGCYGPTTVVLDYNSLYPNGALRRDAHTLVEVQPGTVHAFRRATEDRPGVVPFIVADLICRRMETRARLAGVEADQPARRAALDALQLALKIVANSLYGIFGARYGPAAFRPVAESTTALGRAAIEVAVAVAEQMLPDASVLYGDTDSIFVHIPGASLEEAFVAGDSIAVNVNALNRARGFDYLNIEVEKVLSPFVLAQKKRYAGQRYTRDALGRPMGPARCISGFSLVTRSAIPASSALQNEILNELLGGGGTAEAAGRAVRSALYYAWRICNGFFSLADVQLTLRNAKGAFFELDAAEGKRKLNPGDYSAQNFKTGLLSKLMERMEARREGSAPARGCSVRYVVLEGAGGVGDCAEEAVFVQSGGAAAPVDRSYYVDRMLEDSFSVLRAALVELGDPFHDRLDSRKKRPAEAAARPSAGAKRARGDRGSDASSSDYNDEDGLESVSSSNSGIAGTKANGLSARVLSFLNETSVSADLEVRVRGEASWVRTVDDDVRTEDGRADPGSSVLVARAAERPQLIESFRRRLEGEMRAELRAAWAADARALGADPPPSGPIQLHEDARRRIFFELHAEGDNPNYYRRASCESVLRHLLLGDPLRATSHPAEWDAGAFLEALGILAKPPGPSGV